MNCRKSGCCMASAPSTWAVLRHIPTACGSTAQVEGADAMQQPDFLQFIFQAINNLLTQNLGFFDAMGQNLFRAFATILVVWFGVKSALAAAGGKHPFHFVNFASLLLTISFGFAMVNY